MPYFPSAPQGWAPALFLSLFIDGIFFSQRTPRATLVARAYRSLRVHPLLFSSLLKILFVKREFLYSEHRIHYLSLLLSEVAGRVLALTRAYLSSSRFSPPPTHRNALSLAERQNLRVTSVLRAVKPHPFPTSTSKMQVWRKIQSPCCT